MALLGYPREDLAVEYPQPRIGFAATRALQSALLTLDAGSCVKVLITTHTHTGRDRHRVRLRMDWRVGAKYPASQPLQNWNRISVKM